jgi:hypothetical protein
VIFTPNLYAQGLNDYMNQKLKISLLLFAIIIFISNRTFAVSIAIDTENLIERSEVIVIGKVGLKTGKKMNWPHRNFDGRLLIHPEVMTEYEIEVSRTLKGEYKDKVINVYGFGGKVEDRQTTWSIGFDFELDDIVLMFLHKDKENGLWTVVGQSQGVYKLEWINGSLRIVDSVHNDLQLVEGGKMSATEHQRLKVNELESFIREREK